MLGAESSLGVLGQNLRVLLAGGEGMEHVAARLAQDVRDDGAELDVAAFQDLGDAVRLRRPFGDQRAPIGDQLPQKERVRLESQVVV